MMLGHGGRVGCCHAHPSSGGGGVTMTFFHLRKLVQVKVLEVKLFKVL